jgi:hypothetical protein
MEFIYLSLGTASAVPYEDIRVLRDDASELVGIW